LEVSRIAAIFLSMMIDKNEFVDGFHAHSAVGKKHFQIGLGYILKKFNDR
jgi:hypothetical protein